MTEKKHEPLMVSPLDALAYAVGTALYEAVSTKVITTEQAEHLEKRANEMHLALIHGDVLTKQEDGTYKVTPRDEYFVDDGTLTIGGE
jgi:hypothetical protein